MCMRVKEALVITVVPQQLLKKDRDGVKIELPGPKPKLRIKANTHSKLRYGITGLASWEKENHTQKMLAQRRHIIHGQMGEIARGTSLFSVSWSRG